MLRSSHRKRRSTVRSSKRERSYRIFISYAHKDSKKLAFRIQSDLAAAGFEVWMDTSRIHGGASWSLEIEKAIDRSDAVLALLSTGSFLSDVCRGEQLRSLRRNKCVIPILVEREADRPIYLESRHYLDFSSDSKYSKDFQHLLSAIVTRQGISLLRQYRNTAYETVPPLPLNYVERPDLLRDLRNSVLDDRISRQIAVTGIRGMGGIGKSVLVQALCRTDEVIQAAFPDGIIWITIGQQPTNIVIQMREIAKALGEDPIGFDTLEDSKKRLRLILYEKAVLIVLDDVWDAAVVEPFLADAPRCKILFTTRNATVAAALGAAECPIDVLTVSEALDLLGQYAKIPRSCLPPEALEIIHECGHLPLALAMVGALVRGKHHRWKSVLARLRSADLEKIEIRLPPYPHSNLLKTIQISLSALGPILRDQYLDLAVFPSDLPIPEGVLEVFWNYTRDQVQDVTDRFVDASLATRNGPSHISLHDLQCDFVRNCNTNRSLTALHNKLLNAYKTRCAEGWAKGPNDGYFFQQLTYHLRSAHRLEELELILLDVEWLHAKIIATHVQAVLSDYQNFAESAESRLIHEAIQLSAHILDEDPGQLGPQLIARLGTIQSRRIQNFLDRMRELERPPWIEVVISGAARAGDALERTLTPSGNIGAVAITADGRLGLSSSVQPGMLKLWDLRTGQELSWIKLTSDHIYTLAVSLDGTRAISVSAGGGAVNTWDIQHRRKVHALDNQAIWGPQGVAMAPNGKQAIVACNDGYLQIWDFDAGRLAHHFPARVDEISAIASSPDGTYIVVAGSTKNIELFDYAGNELLKLYHSDVNALSVTSDGRCIVSGSFDQTVKCWDLKSGTELHSIDLSSVCDDYGIVAVAATLDRRRAVSAGSSGVMTLWDLETHRVLKNWTWYPMLENDDDSFSNTFVFAPTGKYALSASMDSQLQVWNLDKEHYTDGVSSHNYDVTELVSDVGETKFLSVSGEKKTVKVWDVTSGRDFFNLRIPSYKKEYDEIVTTIPMSGDRLLTVEFAGAPEIWDLVTSRKVRKLDWICAKGESIVATALTPDEELLLCGKYNGPLELWNLGSEKRQHTLQAHSQWYTVAVTPDGRYGLSTDESSLKMWDLKSGRVIRNFLCEGPMMINSLGVTKDGHLAIAGSHGGPFQVWNLHSGQRICMLKGQAEDVYGAVLTEDALHTMYGCGNKLIVRNLKTGSEVCHFVADSALTCCAATVSGSLLLAGDKAGGVYALKLHCSDGMANAGG